MFKKIAIFTTSLFTLFTVGQNQERTFTKAEIETIFLQQNLDLLSLELDISQAQGQVIQSKLWPNPRFEISQVNLWKTSDVEQQPIIFGNWGKSQQISLHLEQEIQTASKRRKNIELQELTVEQKQQEFASILAQSKLELRLLVGDLELTQKQIELYQSQISYIKDLLGGYQKQLQQGNISQSEYIRLKAAQFQFQQQYTELTQQEQEYLKQLKDFLNITSDDHFIITGALDTSYPVLNELLLQHWITQGTENRPEVALNQNLIKQSQKQLEIYKAQRIPDITLGVDFDRAGNIMRNFVGFGVSFDLPVLDRNKGNIMSAKIEIQKNQLQSQSLQTSITNNIIQSYKSYEQSLTVLQDMDLDYQQQLESLMIAHQNNFKNKNIGLIQYLDFVEAYLDNKTFIVQTKKQIFEQFENLQFAIGKDL